MNVTAEQTKLIAEKVKPDREWFIGKDGVVYGAVIPERKEWCFAVETSAEGFRNAATYFKLDNPAIVLEMIEYLLNHDWHVSGEDNDYLVWRTVTVRYKNKSLTSCVIEAMLKHIGE